MYSESQGGNMARIDVATRESQSIRPIPRPTGAEAEDDEPRRYRFNWNSPIHISTHDPATIYLGGNHLMRSPDRGTTWEEASPDLTKAIDRDTVPIMGMLVTDETLSRNDGISTYGNITAFGESKHSPDDLYVGTDDGNLQVTRDGGSTWTNVIESVRGVPSRTYVSRIETSAAVDGRVYVTFDGHRNDDYAAYAYVSEDFGSSWRQITDGLPDGWSVNVIREHPANPNLLFLGNEVGVFVSIDRGTSWGRMKNNLPTVAVDDIVIHPCENDLVVGTHGRSIWILDDITPYQEMSGQLLASDSHLFGARRATMWSMGMDWPFQPATFVAPNPAPGIAIRYYLREKLETPPVVDDEMGSASGPNGAGETPARSQSAAGELQLEILDASGDVIRTLEPTNEAGVQQVVWDFRIAPAFEVPGGGGGGGFRGGAAAGSGPKVLPGTYTARLTAGAQTHSMDFEVRHDPRRDVSRADLVARNDAVMRAFALAKPIYESGQRLRAMDQRVSEVQAALKTAEVDAAMKESLQAEADALAEDIGEVRQAFGRANRLGRATSGIENWSGVPSNDQMWSIETTWAEIPAVIEHINELLTTRMPAFEQSVAAAGLRPALGDPIAVPRRP
jgi:hypothetical protein